MDTTIFTLPSGLRVIHCHSRSEAAYCGLTINAGTRDEDPEEHGIAHFVEHMLFKGTQKHSIHFINNRLESVGGELNAFTAKEETVIHATILKNDLGKALELIAQLAFAPAFPEKEIHKERVIIIDEINASKDNPAEQIFDDFEERLFSGATIGRPILGNADSLQQINASCLQNFVAQHYHSQNMVLSVVGNFRPHRVEQLAEKHFGAFHNPGNPQARILPEPCATFRETFTRNTFQAHCIIGTRAYALHDTKRIGLALLNNYLGGPASNSLLNSVLREKYGLVYHIESNYGSFTDCGVLSVYFGTDKEQVEQCRDLVFKEFEKLREEPVNSKQLQRIKKQLIGQLTIAADNGEAQMLNQGKSLLIFNKVDSLKRVAEKIEAVTAEQLLEIVQEIFRAEQLSWLIYV
ncbi:MAG: insulinase family protein [Prevotellaceae bacterium]|jgi:predicted Zn-dependent peptidase|nr:insulinase family protein [Prevotellaceae bacterium]